MPFSAEFAANNDGILIKSRKLIKKCKYFNKLEVSQFLIKKPYTIYKQKRRVQNLTVFLAKTSSKYHTIAIFRLFFYLIYCDFPVLCGVLIVQIENLLADLTEHRITNLSFPIFLQISLALEHERLMFDEIHPFQAPNLVLLFAKSK